MMKTKYKMSVIFSICSWIYNNVWQREPKNSLCILVLIMPDTTLSALHTCNPLARPWDRGYDCAHFRDKETKAQKG